MFRRFDVLFSYTACMSRVLSMGCKFLPVYTTSHMHIEVSFFLVRFRAETNRVEEHQTNDKTQHFLTIFLPRLIDLYRSNASEEAKNKIHELKRIGIVATATNANIHYPVETPRNIYYQNAKEWEKKLLMKFLWLANGTNMQTVQSEQMQNFPQKFIVNFLSVFFVAFFVQFVM